MKNASYTTNEPARPKDGAAFPGGWWAGWFKRPRRKAAHPLEELFWNRLVFDPKTGCRVWTESGDKPYGKITMSVHRLA